MFAKARLTAILIKLNRELLLGREAVMAEKKDTDLHKIKELIEIMKDNDLVEVEIKHGDDKILLKRSQAQPPTVSALPVVGPNILAPPVAPGATHISPPEAANFAAQPTSQDDLVDIKSPIVGTFYATPSPDSGPFVEVGSQVDPQTIVCIVEAMKVMNEIKAGTSGTIIEILVANGQAVEYGRVLFKVKPD